jgi:hypothetical protein
MNALLNCKCYGMDPACIMCHGHEKLEITQTYWIPSHFDFSLIKFEGIGGLFQVFLSGDKIIGAGNIEYNPESRCYFIYELHSFLGKEGHKIMIDTMLATGDIDFVEGYFRWEECSH